MKRTDLTGKKFNRLTVLKFSHYDKHKNPYWICACECGNESIVKRGNLVTGTTKSCGCFQKEANRLRQRKLPGSAGFRALICSYKYAAKKRNFSFELSDEECLNLFKSQCFYCGVGPNQVRVSTKSWHGTEARDHSKFLYNGIDRIDSSKGYALENVVACCGVCNVAKNDATQVEFINWVRRVYNFTSTIGLTDERQKV